MQRGVAKKNVDNLDALNKELSDAGISPTAFTKNSTYIMSGGDHPVPLLIFENICRALERDKKLMGRFRLNEFSHMVEAQENGEWKNLSDIRIYEMQRYISSNYRAFAKISTDMTTSAIRATAYQNKVNPPRDYLTGLSWDKVARLDSWLTSAYGTPDTAVYHAIGSNWIKGLVKRVMQPGCQFDEILVLESPTQGWRKSTSLRELAKPWHVECTTSINDKDFYMNIAQNVVVEFSEGDALTRVDARKIKAIVTKVEDQWRAPYERGLQTYPRGCVFAMTTNDRDYQKDDTGGRRWLPVELQKIADIDWIKENRDQLYAEAYHRVMALKETTHEYPQEEIESMQDERMEHDDYEEAVARWYVRLPAAVKEEGIRIIDVYQGVMSKDSDKEMSRLVQMQLAGMLRRVLFLEKRQNMQDGIRAMRWYSSRKTPKSKDILEDL